MSVSQVHVARRSPLIPILRIALPAIAAATTLAVLVAAGTSALRSGEQQAQATRPVELVAPRLVGEDDRQRPFVITADSAEREDRTNRIRLNAPVLVRDAGGRDELRVSAASGVFDETARRLELSGDVELTGRQGVFSTRSAVYDGRSGEVVGSGAVRASGDLGEMQAGSFAVKEKGDSVVYKGGVRTRLNVK